MAKADRVVLLDRDGTLIEERHYLASPEGVVLLPGAARALAVGRALGWRFLLITNQAGIGRGYFDAHALTAVHDRLQALLAAEGARLDGIYYCPHHPDDGCACRKPAPGLVWQAVRDWDFDPTRAVMVGDKPCDLLLGRAVGAHTCLVRTGYGHQYVASHAAAIDTVLDDMAALPPLLERLSPR